MIEYLGNPKFSRWLAPVIGLVVATALAGKQILAEGEQDFTFAMIIGGLGLFSGLIILVADQSEAQREEQIAKSPGRDPEFRTIARALAVIGLVVSILPIVGLAVSLCALAANIRHRGWPRIVSGVGALIGIGMLFILFGS